MLTQAENDVLTQVEGEAPMGQLMRQHWIPACLCEEVAEPDCIPVRLRLLGTNLVVFRDSEGELGILDEACPHRGVSLALGRNEKCGLRCLYHGWKFNIHGEIVEMPSEPQESPLLQKVQQRSYPVEECGGFVWTYLGDSTFMRPFERPAFAPAPTTTVSILKVLVPCNWAQIEEGQIDSAHSSSLHSTEMKPAKIDSAEATEQNWLRPSTDKSPRLQSEKTTFGFQYAALRRPIKNAATNVYARVTVYIAPFLSLIPPNNLYNVASINVPVDNHNTMFYFIAWGGSTCISTEDWRKFNHAVPGVDLDEQWRPVRNSDNNFKQDRAAMSGGQNFTGIDGIPNQDIAMWTTMGPVTDRSSDTLGASDLAVVEFRRLMVDAALACAKGEPAIGTTEPHIPQVTIGSFEGIIAKNEDWRELVQAARERARQAIDIA